MFATTYPGSFSPKYTDGWLMVGSPLLDTGGRPWTPKTGSPLDVVWFEGDTIMPYPWVYCRWVLTHDAAGRSSSLISRTPTTAGVSLPFTS